MSFMEDLLFGEGICKVDDCNAISTFSLVVIVGRSEVVGDLG